MNKRHQADRDSDRNSKRPRYDEDRPRNESPNVDSSLARRIAEAKARVQAQAALMQAAPESLSSDKKGLKTEVHPSIAALTQSSSARAESAFATQLIPKPQFATVKANLRIAQKIDKSEKYLAAKNAEKQADAKPKNPYLEMLPRQINSGAVMPKPRAPKPQMRFVQQGQYIAEADQLRAKVQLEKLRQEIADRTKKTGLEAELDLVGDSAIKRDEIPLVEWWDIQFISSKDYAELDNGNFTLGECETITELVQHPALIDPPSVSSGTTVKSLVLTKEEQKKSRRLRRSEALKERQEKQRLGLLPPDAPKIKLSNLMRVVGEQAVSDPTQIEKMVREQVMKRAMDHQQTNDERKLTPEQRAEKRAKKLAADAKGLTHVALFRIRDLSHPQHRFKIRMNAQQHALNGMCIVHGDCNIVVVEGGPNAVKRYKNLMLRRIRWDEQPISVLTSDDAPSVRNECTLVWEGVVRRPEFGHFRVHTCPTESKCKEVLGAQCEHYWELARGFVHAA